MKKLGNIMAVSGAIGAMTANERAKGRYMRDGAGHPSAVAEFKTWVSGVEKKLEQHGVDSAVVAEIKARVDDVEQKLAKRGTLGGGDGARSVGAAFVQAKGVELSSMGRSDRVALEIKEASLTSATVNAPGAVGALVDPYRDAAVPLARRRLTIRALLTVVNITSGSVEYPKQKTPATGAGMVAEGMLKPQSDMQFVLENAPVRTIAHWVKASRQILDDAAQLQGMIDSELRYGLSIKEEAQLIYGDGIDQNLPGMFSRAAAFVPALAIPDANEIDKIGLAILQASLTDFEPDGVVLHPSIWWKMRLTKDADGKYLLGDPMQAVPNNLFGLPVVPTQAMNPNDFMVGAFTPQTLYDRMTARVEAGFVNDDFTRNLVTILGEERVAFAMKQPQAVIAGDFTE